MRYTLKIEFNCEQDALAKREEIVQMLTTFYQQMANVLEEIDITDASLEEYGKDRIQCRK